MHTINQYENNCWKLSYKKVSFLIVESWINKMNESKKSWKQWNQWNHIIVLHIVIPWPHAPMTALNWIFENLKQAIK